MPMIKLTREDGTLESSEGGRPCLPFWSTSWCSQHLNFDLMYHKPRLWVLSLPWPPVCSWLLSTICFGTTPQIPKSQAYPWHIFQSSLEALWWMIQNKNHISILSQVWITITLGWGGVGRILKNTRMKLGCARKWRAFYWQHLTETTAVLCGYQQGLTWVCKLRIIQG